MRTEFGGPKEYSGRSLREAHAHLEIMEEHFTAVAENLQTTLEELDVPADLITEVMEIVGSTKAEILNL